MRTYSFYYIAKKVRCFITPSDVPNLQSGIIYFGVRFQDVLLKNNDLYKALGFKLNTECSVRIGDEVLTPTMFKLYSQTNAARLGLIQRVGFSIIPDDPNRTIPPYNDRYNTGSAVLGGPSINDTTKILKKARFNFGTSNNPIIYKIDPVSIKLRRSKDTTMHLYG